MKNILLASVAAIALLAGPVLAQETTTEQNTGAAVGGATGGATGAVVGGLIFGPIGAVIGGFTGATIGAAAGVEANSVEYARMNPTEPVVIEGGVDVGYVVPEAVVINPIEGDSTYGYFYTNDRLYFVDLSNRTVVYSPGTVVAVQAQ
jgi:hypothetical protein